MIQLFEVVNFTYLYRDGANWKNGGNTPFTNKQGLPIEEIDKRIRAAMLDGNCQFHPEDVDLDNYFYCDCQYENGDHHEFDGVAFSQSAVRPERDITELIAALEKSKAERNKPQPPRLALFKFAYQHKVGEPEIICHLLIAACTYEQAAELGNQRLARDFPGEQDGGNYYSTDGSEAAKMVDCKEILQGFYPDASRPRVSICTQISLAKPYSLRWRCSKKSPAPSSMKRWLRWNRPVCSSPGSWMPH